MNEILFVKLVDYVNLNNEIKLTRNPIRTILIAAKLEKLKNSIISMVNNNVLNFNELYMLLKLLEKKSFGKIHFQACRFYYENIIFEDKDVIDGIRIFKKTDDKNDIIDILFDNCLYESKYDKIVKSHEISPDEVALPNVSNILFKIKVLYDKEYNKLANLIIAYLIKREKIWLKN